VTGSLLDLPRGRRTGPQQDPERYALLNAFIDEHYLKQPRLRPEEINQQLDRRCKLAGLKPVSRGAVHARLARFDPELVARKRYGAKHADATVAPKGGPRRPWSGRASYPQISVTVSVTFVDVGVRSNASLSDK
jgi:hypothetical protein